MFHVSSKSNSMLIKNFYLDISYRWWTVKTWSGNFHDKTSTFLKNSSRVRLFIAFKVLIFLSYSFIEPCPTNIVELFTFFILTKPLLTLICRYDPRKGFFCQVINGDHTKCLGKSKGRRYPMMDVQSAKYLQVLYQYFLYCICFLDLIQMFFLCDFSLFIWRTTSD